MVSSLRQYEFIYFKESLQEVLEFGQNDMIYHFTPTPRPQLMTDMSQVDKNVQEVQKAIDQFNKHKELRNRARQLRSEAPASFPMIRDAPLPVRDMYDPFTLLERLAEPERRTHGKVIFERIANYLRLLAARELYPRGNLLDQVIVRITDGKLTGIQLIPKYLSKQAQPLEYIQELINFLYVSFALPASKKSVDFFFPPSGTIVDTADIEAVAKIVSSVDDIVLAQDSGKVFICDGRILSSQIIYEAKHKSFDKQNSDDLWIMLARFCTEHTAINQIHLIPDWVHEFVKYDNPSTLPELFVNNCNSKTPLESLRIVLGMYPTKLELFDVKDPKDIVAAITEKSFPIWYQSRIFQLMMIANEFTVGDKVVANGVVVSCPARPEALKELITKYE